MRRGILATSIGIGLVVAGCTARQSGSACEQSSDCASDAYCLLDPDGSSGMCTPLPDAETGDAADAVADDLVFVPLQDVDILVVIDNSGSMGAEQARLAANFGALVQRLDSAGLDYRIGFTTSDNGNVECSGTSPEGGQMRLVSCTQREDEFTWPKVNPTVQAYDLACTSVCPENIGNALAIAPTTTANDATPKPRPWLESIDGVTNVQGGTLLQALQCFAPQGVDGCGFEAPLETMYKAIERSEVSTENEFDFFREGSAKVVLIVTDEADCSANEAHQAQVFDRNLPAAQKVFWSDPNSSIPTSAICWNAGTRCYGSSGVYDFCEAANYATTGIEVPDPDAAVLRPIDRYIDRLNELQSALSTSTGAPVIVHVIGGVPVGYGDGNAEIAYRDSADPTVQANFGIDWGCQDSSSSDNGGAVPPVRLREVAEGFASPNGRNVSSICADNYLGAFDQIMSEIGDALGRGDL